MRQLLLLFCLLFFAGPASSQNQGINKPAKLGLCVGCHGENGKAVISDYPNLAGQNRAYLVKALNAYKSGVRNSPEMKVAIATLKPADIEALALWFSAQKLP